ncbi:MAG TPA: carbohydrate ABC transporter permease, partial [Myxococcaceae bacterium]|nr:carbohydrate ABC transporter permease [Myxococcaceae bacterium]
MATASRIERASVTDESVGMSYLDRVPRRIVTVWLPLLVFMFVLLFPFYWMGITALKPNAELTNFTDYSPFWPSSPTLRHINYLLFETSYPGWLWNTMLVALGSTFLSLFASVFAAYAIERIRFKGSRWTGLGIFLAYLVPPSILFIPLAVMV